MPYEENVYLQILCKIAHSKFSQQANNFDLLAIN